MFWEKIKYVLQAFGLLVVYQLPSLFVGILVALGQQTGQSSPLWGYALVALLYFLVIAGFILYAKKMGYWTPKSHWLKGKNAIIIIVGYVLILGVNIAISLLGNVETTANQEVVESLLGQVPLPLYFIMLVVAAPICEEIIFRGIVFKSLVPKSVPLAFIISIVTFALVHGPTDLGSFLIYAGMGAIISLSYYLTQSLEVSIGVHMLNNFIAFLGIVLMSYFS
ncbi:CPBP family intramembrane glutamic endopeptidase [Streptococcus rifensis]